MFIIVLFAALIALFTAATDRAVDGAKGSKAPVFKIERADSLVQLDNLKGSGYSSSSGVRPMPLQGSPQKSTHAYTVQLQIAQAMSNSVTWRSTSTVRQAFFVR